MAARRPAAVGAVPRHTLSHARYLSAPPRCPSPQVLRRAKLTETAMRLAVLGLTADAERFTLDASS